MTGDGEGPAKIGVADGEDKGEEWREAMDGTSEEYDEDDKEVIIQMKWPDDLPMLAHDSPEVKDAERLYFPAITCTNMRSFRNSLQLSRDEESAAFIGIFPIQCSTLRFPILKQLSEDETIRFVANRKRNQKNNSRYVP